MSTVRCHLCLMDESQRIQANLIDPATFSAGFSLLLVMQVEPAVLVKEEPQTGRARAASLKGLRRKRSAGPAFDY